MDEDMISLVYRPYGSSIEHGRAASEMVVWNTYSPTPYKGLDYSVESEQFGHGYVIGTQGNAIGINTKVDSQYNSSPEDWLEIDLGSLQTISAVQVAFFQAQQPTSLQVQVSENALHWQAFSTELNSVDSTELQDFELGRSLAVRYLKLIFKTDHAMRYHRISEVDVRP